MRFLKQKNFSGISLVEIMVAAALSLTLFAAGGILFQSGVATWRTGDSQVRLQESLRFTIEYIHAELRQSDLDHVEINDGLGFGASDAITFSIPVTCNSDPLTLCELDCGSGQDCLQVCEWEEIAGDENFIWGAPLTWGCKDPSCMDADNSCATFDYKYIRYWINADERLERVVLDSSGAAVATQAMMPELADLQFSLNGSMITMDVTAQHTKNDGNVMTAQTSMELYLRN